MTSHTFCVWCHFHTKGVWCHFLRFFFTSHTINNHVNAYCMLFLLPTLGIFGFSQQSLKKTTISSKQIPLNTNDHIAWYVIISVWQNTEKIPGGSLPLSHYMFVYSGCPVLVTLVATENVQVKGVIEGRAWWKEKMWPLYQFVLVH